MSNQIQVSLVEGANPAINAERFGTVIRLTTTDDNVEQVIRAGYTHLIVERSKDGGITYEEATAPSERVLLEASKPSMEYFDRRGDSSYFYRFRYMGVIAGQCEVTEPSVEIEGAGLAIRDLLTVAQLKARYLFGVDLRDDSGNILTEATFAHYILAAVRWMEHELDIPILPTVFVEQHDYYRNDFGAYAFLKLDNAPVLSVEEFRVQYPSGQNVIVWPNEWLRLNAAEGHLQVVPTAGTLSEVLIGTGGGFLPALYGGLPYLPQLFQVTYTAGFASGKVPRNIVDLIGMFASMGPFNIFGDLIAGAGIASFSLSLDGLSQSINTTSSATNSGYGSRIIQYLKQIKQQIPVLRRYYKGQRMVVG